MINIDEIEIMKNWNKQSTVPLVSICTITYNHEEFIENALDSFLMQKTDFPYEIVIDEDNSTDRTAHIARLYSQKYPHIIKLNTRTKNVGSMKNFLENLKRARGKYIAICEGDDFWIDNNKLQKQVDLMQKNPQFKLSFHPAKLVEYKTVSEKTIANYSEKIEVFDTKTVIKGSGSFCPTSSIMIKREVLDSLPHWFLNSPVGDYFLQIIASHPNGAIFMPDVMSIYRQNTQQSWTSSMKSLQKQEIFYLKMIDTFNELDKFLHFTYKKEIAIMKSLRNKIMFKKYIEHFQFKKAYDTLFRDFELSEKNSIKISLFYLLPYIIYKLKKLPWK